MSSNIQQPIAYGQSVGHISHHCFSLHSELLEQTQLQVRREVWVLFLLAQGGTERSWVGCGHQKRLQRPHIAQIVPGTIEQRRLHDKP